MKPLNELRRALDTARASMETIHAEIRESAAGADFDDLERQFREAERGHTVAAAAYRDGAALDDAKRNLKVAIIETDDDDEDERAPAGPWNLRTAPGARVTHEPLTYERHARHSIFDDLGRAYAQQLDSKILNSTVTNAKGLLQVSGTNAVTYTDTTPTVPELYAKVADAYQKVNTGRFLPPQYLAMTPMRWAWILASLDTQNRPLVVPVGQPGFNAAGLSDKIAAEDIVGTFFGLPVVVDANLPTTLGAGTNEDRIIVYRGSDCYLWESEPRLRVFEEVLSSTLSVRLQVYGYFAVVAGRLPAAISIISGSGLSTVSF